MRSMDRSLGPDHRPHSLRQIHPRLELVEELSILTTPQPGAYWEHTDWVLEPFADAPRLRSLSLRLLVRSLSPRTVHLLWSSLTTFVGQYMDTDDCVFVLKEAANLTHCTLLNVATGIDDDVEANVRLPRLCVLNMDGPYMDDFLHVLSFLTLPTLHTLSLGSLEEDTLDHPTDIYWTSLESFLTRSAPPVTRLSVSADTWSADDLLNCIQLMPSVVHLEIIGFTDGFSGLLPLVQTAETYVPCLQTLVFRAKTPPTSYEVLLLILLARTSPNLREPYSRLTNFECTWSDPNEYPGVDEETLEQFRIFASRGLSVHLGQPDISFI
uniref:F-box domain-containing protein n=1 Tax=Mycena chlorophos TaxID=658473 RepID=A0ABQ0M7N9_MYCCL|nr:predicted protein [Mycena chlorophos]